MDWFSVEEALPHFGRGEVKRKSGQIERATFHADKFIAHPRLRILKEEPSFFCSMETGKLLYDVTHWKYDLNYDETARLEGSFL